MRLIFLQVLLAVSLLAGAQPDSSSGRGQRVRFVAISAGLSAGSLVVLQQAWYKQYQEGRFHFFDDHKDWLQMDKAGHLYSTYQVGRLMMEACARNGFTRKTQLLYGGGSGFAYMTVVECLDGYSRGWGFSWADEAANAGGTLLAIGQEALWKQQRFMLRFSYYPSGLAKFNPALLGRNDGTRILKDYNAQTYWLSFSPGAFAKKSFWPRWLCLSFGYGATGMLGGSFNPAYGQQGEPLPEMTRQRIFLFSLDVDLTALPVKNKLLKRVLSFVNIIHVPAPALSLRGGVIRGHYLYF